MNVLEVRSERLAHQPFHIFEDESFGLQLAHRSHGLGKHVALVGLAAGLAAHRERLTRGASGNHNHLATDLAVIEGARVAFKERPFVHVVGVQPLVVPESFAGIVVPLDDRRVTKAGPGHSHGQATRARKEFNTSHGRRHPVDRPNSGYCSAM